MKHWEERKAHLVEARRRRKEIWDRAAGWGVKRTHWKSWVKHPLSNIAYYWWHLYPHKPKWRIEETLAGPVNFSSRVDAEWGYVSDVCKRCGLEKDIKYYDYPPAPD